MKKRKQLQRIFKRYFTPLNLIMIFIVSGTALILLIYTSQKISLYQKKNEILPQQNYLQVNDGEREIIIYENGQIEFRYKSYVFHQKWDSEKVRRLFDDLAKQEELGKTDLQETTEETMQVFLNGELKTITVGKNNPLTEILDNLAGFKPDIAPGSSPSRSLFSPSPSPKTDKAVVPMPPDCELWGEQISQRTVISNSVCVKERQQ